MNGYTGYELKSTKFQSSFCTYFNPQLPYFPKVFEREMILKKILQVVKLKSRVYNLSPPFLIATPFSDFSVSVNIFLEKFKFCDEELLLSTSPN